MATRFDAVGLFDARNVLGDGSSRIPAYLTRTGIFVYHDATGREIRELRPASEVFDATSLASLRGVTVTVGHPDMIDSKNWREHGVGHVGDNVREEGIYIAADLVVKDASALARIDSKDLVELSCGYSVDLDFTAGTFEGEAYDAVQRNIRYNHVALGGTNWGRAGANVRLLDSRGSHAEGDVVYAASVRMAGRTRDAWRDAPAPARTDTSSDPIEAAQLRMIARNRDAWKK